MPFYIKHFLITLYIYKYIYIYICTYILFSIEKYSIYNKSKKIMKIIWKLLILYLKISFIFLNYFIIYKIILLWITIFKKFFYKSNKYKIKNKKYDNINKNIIVHKWYAISYTFFK